MRLLIGRDDTGQPVILDTRRDRRILLTGPSGVGATTVCRYLARVWLAAGRPVTVCAAHPHEYADLSADWWPDSRGARGGRYRRLLILDDTNTVPSRTVVDALCQTEQAVLLVHAREPPTRITGLVDLTLALQPAGRRWSQSRTPPGWAQLTLEWPGRRVILYPVGRGPRDQPPHRWAADTSAVKPGLWTSRRSSTDPTGGDHSARSERASRP